LVLPHSLLSGGQDCNRLLLVTLWLLVGVVVEQTNTLTKAQVVAVRVDCEQAHYL
jgi:hypothetical protein